MFRSRCGPGNSNSGATDRPLKQLLARSHRPTQVEARQCKSLQSTADPTNIFRLGASASPLRPERITRCLEIFSSRSRVQLYVAVKDVSGLKSHNFIRLQASTRANSANLACFDREIERHRAIIHYLANRAHLANNMFRRQEMLRELVRLIFQTHAKNTKTFLNAILQMFCRHVVVQHHVGKLVSQREATSGP